MVGGGDAMMEYGDCKSVIMTAKEMDGDGIWRRWKGRQSGSTVNVPRQRNLNSTAWDYE